MLQPCEFQCCLPMIGEHRLWLLVDDDLADLFVRRPCSDMAALLRHINCSRLIVIVIIPELHCDGATLCC